MRLTPTPEPVIAKRWRDHYQARIERGERKHQKRALRGLELVMRVGGGREVQFRGRKYGVPPVPWEHVPRVLRAQERWDALTALKNLRSPEWPSMYREVASLFKLLCKPVERPRRLFWRFIPSPLLSAAHLEVGQFLGFISTFQRLDCGESPQAILAGLRRDATSQSSSDGSPLASPHGATNGDAR